MIYLVKLHERLAGNGRLILGLLLLNLLFMATVLPYAAGMLGEAQALDVMLLYSPQTAYETIASYGEEGRAFYLLFALIGDLLYPLIYTPLLALGAGYLLRRAYPGGPLMQRLALYIYPVFLFDVMENLGIVVLLSRYPQRLDALVYVTQLFTLLKFAVAVYGLGLGLLGLFRLVVTNRSPRSVGRG